MFATTAAIYQFTKNYVLALICAGVVSICDEFFNPADRAILKETVTSEQELNNLISKVSSIDQFVGIAGTVLSGLLLTFLISDNVMLICSLLSLVSLVFLFYALKNVKDRPKTQKNESKYYRNIIRKLSVAINSSKIIISSTVTSGLQLCIHSLHQQ